MTEKTTDDDDEDDTDNDDSGIDVMLHFYVLCILRLSSM